MIKNVFISICLLLIVGCSTTITKSEFKKIMTDKLETMSFCREVDCRDGLILEDEVNHLIITCIEKKVLEPLPNEMTSSQIKKIIEERKPELEQCIRTKIEFTPIISKKRMIFFVKDRDNSADFSKFSPNISKLDLNNLVANCYQDALEELPLNITVNQVKTVTLEVQRCVYKNLNSTN